MRERATQIFPFALSAALPLAGVVLAGIEFVEGDRERGAWLIAAALLGALIWFVLLG